MQFGRRVEDRIRILLREALATYHPERSVLSQLKSAIDEYRVLKASGRRLSGQRSDDLTVVHNALGIDTVGLQPN
jgi:hypothetical protein